MVEKKETRESQRMQSQRIEQTCFLSIKNPFCKYQMVEKIETRETSIVKNYSCKTLLENMASSY